MPAGRHLIPEPGNVAGWFLARLPQIVCHQSSALPDESPHYPHEGDGNRQGDEKDGVRGGFQFLKEQQKYISLVSG